MTKRELSVRVSISPPIQRAPRRPRAADNTRVHVTVLLTSYQRLLPHLSSESMMVQLKRTLHETILIISAAAEVVNPLFLTLPPFLLSLWGELALNYS